MQRIPAPPRGRLAGLLADDLVRDSVMLVGASMVVHVCNALFQVVMGRVLPAEEFALLAALLSLLGMAGLPLSTLQLSISRTTRLLIDGGRVGDVGRLVRRWAVRMGAASALLAAVVMLGAEPLMAMVNVDRSAPVLLLIPLVPATLFSPLFHGVVHGMARMGLLASTGAIAAIVRILAAWALVAWMAPAAGWALLGHGIGLYVLMGLLGLSIVSTRPGAAGSGQPLPSLRMHLGQSFVLLLGISAFMFGDMVLVKNRFPEAAPAYASAATAARMVVFLPSAVATAMYPRVVSDAGKRSPSHAAVWMKSLGLILLCLAPVVIVCTLAPGMVVRLLFGVAPDADLEQWTRMLTWALIPVALLNGSVRFCIAQQRFLLGLPAVLASGGFVIYALAGAARVEALIAGLGWLAAAAFVITFGGALRR